MARNVLGCCSNDLAFATSLLGTCMFITKQQVCGPQAEMCTAICLWHVLQEAAAARAELQRRQEALAADEAQAMEDLAAAGNRLQVLQRCQACNCVAAACICLAENNADMISNAVPTQCSTGCNF